MCESALDRFTFASYGQRRLGGAGGVHGESMGQGGAALVYPVTSCKLAWWAPRRDPAGEAWGRCCAPAQSAACCDWNKCRFVRDSTGYRSQVRGFPPFDGDSPANRAR